ncbi:rod shape-determining protein MreC [Polymorphobacter sp.]|uniref:rod shape-determining protein MreC n=1 Tax=Polymorphobacter sp. TaxID=1909290 RepID=UPI003F716D62
MDWTPAPRRSSAMRREQNLAIIGALVSGAVVATGLVMLLIARVNPEGSARIRSVVMDIVAPIWSVVRAPVDGIGRAGDEVGAYFGAVSRNRRLEAELAAARAALQAAAADRQALRQLKRFQPVAEPQRRLIITARIVSATPGSVVRTAIIAAGARDGVRVGQPAISADGLIGRTVEVGRHSARLLLLSDPASRVPVVIVRTGESALVSGDNSPILLLSDRAGADVPLQAGDELLTSGEGGIYPPGVPVGRIISPDLPLKVRPAASPMGAGFVRIEAAYLPLPADPQGPIFDAPVPAEAQRQGAVAGTLRGAAPAPSPAP